MKNLLLIGLALVLFPLFSSCKKGGFKTSSDRIMGEWYFDKVKYREGGTFRTHNITDDYRDLEVEFTSDFKFIETNTLEGESRSGIWEIKRYNTPNAADGNSSWSEMMSCPIYDASTGLIDLIEWEQLSVTRNRICATEYKAGGTFWYTLRRN